MGYLGALKALLELAKKYHLFGKIYTGKTYEATIEAALRYIDDDNINPRDN